VIIRNYYKGETMMHDFLPMSREDMEKRGWDQCDFVYVCGDAYVDHPSFGHAIISRILEAHGYRVGIISQPDWKNKDSITVLRIQLILQRGKFSYVFSQQCLGLRFGQITGIASIKLRNAMFLTGLGQQSLQDFLFHSANQLIILTSSFSNRLPIR